jgi:hypothetical protein
MAVDDVTALPNSLLALPGESSDRLSFEPRGDEMLWFCCRYVEGKIGKLIVRASGKMELMIGDIPFEVSTGLKSSFLQVCLACAVTMCFSMKKPNWFQSGPHSHHCLCDHTILKIAATVNCDDKSKVFETIAPVSQRLLVTPNVNRVSFY